MAESTTLAPHAQKLLTRFVRARAKADRVLDELDSLAQNLACSLLDDGLSLRQAAPVMSREDLPFSFAQVAHARDGGKSLKPWSGHRKKGIVRG